MTLNQPYKTIIVDDEAPARLRIKNLAGDFNDVIEIVDEAENGLQAVEQINRLKPDLVFLDIRMPGLDGLEVLKQINHFPTVVFCTAFDEFALQAFDSFCIDYLLKPVTKERFAQTINKLKLINGQQSEPNIRDLISKLSSTQKHEEVTSIPVKLGDKVVFVRLEDVSYFKADEKYVTLVTKHAKSFILDSSLKKLEDKLPPSFLRVHKSFIVSKNLLKEVHKHFNNRFVLILDDYEQTRITTGRNYYNIVKHLFDF
ncbi:MAG: response regulator transcription factor [Prolixibacteraceae bacterium]|nr:response regulator transcription factor [Prolixibacteraceae bacterium]